MKSLRKFLLIKFSVIGLVCVQIVSAQIPDQSNVDSSLLQGFLNPDNAAKPSIYFLMLNGYLNQQHIGIELEQLNAAGIGGLCVFDMGALGSEEDLPPAGPKFLSEEWIDNFGTILSKAGELNMNVQLAVSSSWDMGGSWVEPHEASLALYHNSFYVTGPSEINRPLSLPTLSSNAILDSNGIPVFQKDIAVLAVPVIHRQVAHEFIFMLAPSEKHTVDHVVLYNCQNEAPTIFGCDPLYSKEFSIAVSTTDFLESSFSEVIKSSLEGGVEPQRFDFSPVEARYVRLRLYSNPNTKSRQLQLGEFEVYSHKGENLVVSPRYGRGDGGMMVRFNSEFGHENQWTASNIVDGSFSGPEGCWASEGLPPLVVEDPGSIVDITEFLDEEGTMNWEVPPGEWKIMRYLTTNSGEKLKIPNPASDGLATDHMNALATSNYIEYLVGSLEEKLGDIKNTPLRQLYLPSYEVIGSLWTPDFLEQFQEYRGYDMTKYLPALNGLIIENEEITNRFLYDFQKTLGDLLVDAYYRTSNATANKFGLEVEAEAGGPGPPVHKVPVDALKALGSIGEMRGEFWPWRPDKKPLWVIKETASAAHIYGHPLVHMEAFTGFRHWQDGPSDLKASADRAFCEGMNHVVWHTAAHLPPESGKPGWVYGAGTHINTNLVWWPMAKPFLTYLSRCSFMLQRGLFVGDVCYYYGDKGANFVPPKHVDPALGFGFDYDVTNKEVIVNRMEVDQGRIVLPDGMQYEMLVLPDQEDMDYEVLQKIEKLVREGATVVGPKPTCTNGLTDFPVRDLQVRQLANLIWGDCDGIKITENNYGAGKIVWGPDLRDILLKRGVGPDFQYTGASDADLDFIHRRTEDEDIYFISNKRKRDEAVEAFFRVSDKTPEIWDPERGEIYPHIEFNQTQRGTSISLKFTPEGSLFVVFRKPGVQNPVQKESREVAEVELSAPWKLKFPSGWGAPESTEIEQLKSWTEFENPGIRHFSGIAVYETEFKISRKWLGHQRGIILDLGDLWSIGRVHLNGIDMGIVWKLPYQLDITDVIRKGNNVLKVEIANTWANRLIGDALFPEEKQYGQTNITGTETERVPWNQVPLNRSGLFGPVRLIAVD